MLSTSFCQMRSLLRILTNDVHPICRRLPSTKSSQSGKYFTSRFVIDPCYCHVLSILQILTVTVTSCTIDPRMNRLFFEGRIAIGIGTFPSVVKKLDKNLARPRVIASETKGLRLKLTNFHVFRVVSLFRAAF